jgi:UDP-arabinose 4-epimerase
VKQTDPAGSSGKVLVTGGAGYVGSHACKALAKAGYVPIVFDDLSRGHCAAVRWGPLVEGELSDTELLTATLCQHRVSAVMHFAAYANVGEAVADPASYYKNNVGGTLSLLSAMREAGVGLLVFSSSCAIYGIPDRVPIAEDTPAAPVNAYGETKLAIERALFWYGQAYGLRSVSLRYFNAAGADPEGEIGEQHDPETHLIPLAIRAALGQTSPIAVYGTDYPTPDGTAIRDYVHVSDLADAHVQALDHLARGGASTALNLGTGRGYSVYQVIAAIERVGGRKVPRHETGRRAGDPPALVADTGLARSVLKWVAQRSDIETIVETAMAWHMSHPTGFTDKPPAAAAEKTAKTGPGAR